MKNEGDRFLEIWVIGEKDGGNRGGWNECHKVNLGEYFLAFKSFIYETLFSLLYFSTFFSSRCHRLDLDAI